MSCSILFQMASRSVLGKHLRLLNLGSSAVLNFSHDMLQLSRRAFRSVKNAVLKRTPKHRRNNHGDRGRQVPPPTLGLGDQQCIGPPQLFGRTQLLINASPENILAQLNESPATLSPRCSACTQGQTTQH